ncbi:CHAT domain-containing protein [Winogradskyella ouciana]|uniref:CHAT domain-containing protein n=1 Tax=Winogradskyella ouciana TaxID=2608631 RepID=A0A7K1GI40_9FLAO|nr:CHAT domain-containing protein [Winogradskyella ouciana]MTE28248.1 CHAT domain-containing protein [Winogradskyella ouciana]
MKYFNLLIILLITHAVSAQSKEALQQQFDQQITEIAELAKNGQLHEAIRKGELAKSFAFENFKDSNRNQFNILNKLNFYYKFLNDYDNELATNIEIFKIRNDDLKKEQLTYTNSFKELSEYYLSFENPKAIIPTFKSADENILQQTEQAFQYRFEDERATFLENNILPFINLFHSFAYKTNYRYKSFNHIITNNALLVKGALLNSSKDIIKNLESLNDDIINKKIREYRNLKDFTTFQLSLNEKDRSNQLLTMQGRLIGLESELVLYHRRNFREDFTLKREWRRIQLKEKEIAIEFVRFNYFNEKWIDSTLYVAHLIKKHPNASLEVIPLFEEKQLQHIIKNTSTKGMDNSRGSKAHRINNTTTEDLYNLIIKPLEKHLEGIKTIYFSPDGMLHQIALAALKNTEDKLLTERFNLIQVNSSTSIKRDLKQPRSETALFIGGVDYSYNSDGKPMAKQSTLPGLRSRNSIRGENENWPYLKGTKDEIENLTTLFNLKGKTSNYLTSKAADEKAIKNLSGNSPNILHIATHGFFYENSSDSSTTKTNEYKSSSNPLLRSGLILAGADYAWQNGYNPYEKEDGILTALEISNLDLSQTDLVVLSACETGLGDIRGNEGVYGLQRAFKMAGANMILMSLWEVPDIETAEFMTSFYELWLENNAIRQAFNETQRKMNNLYPNNPDKWAAFVLIE